MSYLRIFITLSISLAVFDFATTSSEAAEVNPYLPADSSFVLSVNLKQLIESKSGREQQELENLIDSVLEFPRSSALFFANLHIKPSEQITRMTMAWSSHKPEHALIIFQGEFNREKIAERIGKLNSAGDRDFKVHSTADATVYEVGEGNERKFACFISYSTLLVSSKRELVEGKQARLNDTVAALIEQADEQRTAWVVALPAALEELGADKELLQGADAVTGSVSTQYAKDVKVECSLLCQGIARATANYKALADQLAVLKSRRAEEHQDPAGWQLMLTILSKVELQARGATVTGKVDLDSKQVDFLLDLLDTPAEADVGHPAINEAGQPPPERLRPSAEPTQRVPEPIQSSPNPTLPPAEFIVPNLPMQTASSWSLDPRQSGAVETIPWQGYKPGDEILVTTDSELKVGTTTVDTIAKGSLFEVKDVQNNWIWIGSSPAGWISSPNVTSFYGSEWLLNDWLKADPSNPRYYTTRALLYEFQGMFDEGLADANQLIRLAPSPFAYHIRGNLHLQLGQIDAAIEDYNLAIEYAPDHTISYVNRGVAWYEKDDYDKSLSDLNLALRLEPKNAKALAHRGDTFCKKAAYLKALDDYELALSIEPGSALALGGRAWLRATCSDEAYRDGSQAVDNALRAFRSEDFSRPLELRRFRRLRYREICAAAFAEIGDFEKAIVCQESMLSRAGEVRPTAAVSRLELYKAGKPYRE